MRKLLHFVLAVLVASPLMAGEVRKLGIEDLEWGNPNDTVTSAGGVVSHPIDNTYKLSSPWVDVRVYGAKGDNVTDDTAAIQAAFNTNAGNYVFPPGIYVVSSQINLPTLKYSIYGRGATIRSTETGNAIFSGSGNLWECIISGLYFDGNNGQVIGIKIDGHKMARIDSNTFYRCYYGVMLYNDSYYSDLYNNKFRECGTGVYVGADGTHAAFGEYPNSSSITGGSFELNTLYGVDLSGVVHFRIIASAIELSGNTNLNIGNSASYVHVFGTRFEMDAGTTWDINIASGSYHNVFLGNLILNPAKINSSVQRNLFLNGTGSDYGGVRNPWFDKNGMLRFYVGSAFKSTTGIGLFVTDAIEWLDDTGSGYGFKIVPSYGPSSQVQFDIYRRSNDNTWTRWFSSDAGTGNTNIGLTANVDYNTGGVTLGTNRLGLKNQTAAPANPVDGMVMYTDCTVWNPGSGRGFYGYDNGAWVKF